MTELAERRADTQLRFNLARDDRNALEQVAREYDRTMASEVRRAVRFYLANYELVDRALRGLPSRTDAALSAGRGND